MDEFTEVESESWLSRLGGSFKSVLTGVVLFIASFPALWMNEGCAVREARTLAEGRSIVEALPSVDRIDPAFDGKLVHAIGRVVAEGTREDPKAGVSTPGIQLRRKVLMYQWQEDKETETKKKVGGGEEKITTYKYRRVWAARPIDSSRFRKPEGHENPASMPMSSKTWMATILKIGVFDFPEFFAERLSRYTPLPVDSKNAEALSKSLGRRATLDEGAIYVGQNPQSPEIGDLRVLYERIESDQTVSLVAMQRAQTFSAYQVPGKNTIALLHEGTRSAAEMFEDAEAANILRTWLFRLGGLFAMFMGIRLFFGPLVVLADVVPLFGNLLGFGASVFAVVLTVVLGGTTIALAWIAYRPLLAIPLLVLAALALVYALTRRKSAR